jgi:uncharacterized protein (DUF1778 family)
MARTERLEIRLSPEEKEAFELAARRHGLTVSDYLRACGHQDVLSEMAPESVKRLVRMNAQSVVDMLASARAATFRVDEKNAKVARAVSRAKEMFRRPST